MVEAAITDWDDAYANGAHIERAEDYPPRWASAADQFRQAHADKELDLAYGKSQRQKLDFFWPTEQPEGLIVFVHGGYWRAFDKSYWSHLAKGALDTRWAVCLPSYDLAPNVRISEITRQIAQAVRFAASKVAGPIRLSGHSAGGHQVTRMLCGDTGMGSEVQDRIEKVVSISGLHDLRPLLKTAMNEDFRLDPDEAARESPGLLDKVRDCDVTAWVGANERPEFIRQSRLLAEAWGGTRFVEDPGKHHFNVIGDLELAQSKLTLELVS